MHQSRVGLGSAPSQQAQQRAASSRSNNSSRNSSSKPKMLVAVIRVQRMGIASAQGQILVLTPVAQAAA
jgi:hypothetical protein